MTSTPRQGQGQKKELQLEQGVEAMLVLLQAMSYLLNADSQKSPSTGHSTSSVLFPTPLYERGLRVQGDYQSRIKQDKMNSKGAIAAWKRYMVQYVKGSVRNVTSQLYA